MAIPYVFMDSCSDQWNYKCKGPGAGRCLPHKEPARRPRDGHWRWGRAWCGRWLCIALKACSELVFYLRETEGCVTSCIMRTTVLGIWKQSVGGEGRSRGTSEKVTAVIPVRWRGPGWAWYFPARFLTRISNTRRKYGQTNCCDLKQNGLTHTLFKKRLLPISKDYIYESIDMMWLFFLVLPHSMHTVRDVSSPTRD